jgi:hypothetical protein
VRKLRNACKIVIATSEGTTLLWRPGHRWEGNIKMDYKGRGSGVDFTGSGTSPVADFCDQSNEL